MRIISLKQIFDFLKSIHHRKDVKNRIDRLIQRLKENNFNNLHDLQEVIPDAEVCKQNKGLSMTIFNIGLEYRLIAIIDYKKNNVFIKHILSHKEYDQERWKKQG
jgi:mRNA interferase HigB